MVKFIGKRLAYAVLTLFLITTATFFLVAGAPGDPIAAKVGQMPEQAQQIIREKYGLDQPVVKRYTTYMKNLLTTGDFGESIIYTGQSANDIIKNNTLVSAKIGLLGLLFQTTIAIVGESGCGKTVSSKAIMRLLPESNTIIGENSEVLFHGEDLLKKSENEMVSIRGSKISMIFQDPMTSLNPTMKIGDQIAESILIHRQISKEEAYKEALEMLQLVKIPNAEKRMKQYPFEFSGGMRQRAMIAIALACKPEILIADEPTTALDVTIQAQIMELIGELQKELDMAMILVTHDLGVVASVADKIQVMYAGKIVERGDVREIFYQSTHPYTRALLDSVPKIHSTNKETLYSLKGTPPDLINPPVGCSFAPRCEYGMNICRKKYPELTKFSDTQECNCWLHDPRADVSNLPENMIRRRQ
ncbi:ATP-binding cassette domain-containing protein [Coprococcus comes]|nr:oligopeptide/dipeptide ABC transporter ATP-binding protein [Coprococcus comes]MDC0785736.1 ATP-binding cassette domain-containing protein [Coprococcus comes]MDC0792275.1 ATP-binding cassette domain-containing protein [Coprococcus comes]